MYGLLDVSFLLHKLVYLKKCNINRKIIMSESFCENFSCCMRYHRARHGCFTISFRFFLMFGEPLTSSCGKPWFHHLQIVPDSGYFMFYITCIKLRTCDLYV
ncbi:hypothetical protein CHS0354_014982 [Potamilus streckersoni]|uniref:Uncharacterized protein n=1 Tax=Potamilus streckersoni TaxID=2493646 RepID=A0AAE0VX96_9BIVA|nr:hypothetical protein CHS0354_014982 [Potamilus streckersoni]